MADALASGASVRKDVGVQVPPRAQVAGRISFIKTLLHRLISEYLTWLYNPLLSIYQKFFDLDRFRIKFAISRSLRRLSDAYTSIRFLSIGSNDGFTDDPFVSQICRNEKISASFIEPVPEVFDLLKSNYFAAVGKTSRLKFHQLAISDFSGSTIFYAVSPLAKDDLGRNLPKWFNQLGSFDRNHILKHLNGILEPFITEIKIDTRTLNDFLLEQGFEELDILQIDAEGYDYKVMSTLDLTRFKPKLILIEHKHLNPEEKNQLKIKLTKINYQLREFRSDLMATKLEN